MLYLIMLFKFLSELQDSISLIIKDHSDEKKLVNYMLESMHPQEPVKDRFLPFFRACEFNDTKNLETIIEKYKDKPLNQNQYKLFIGHVKVMRLNICEKYLTWGVQDGAISSNCKINTLNKLVKYIKKTVHNSDNLMKSHHEIFPNNMNLINLECFNGTLNQETILHFQKSLNTVDTLIDTFERDLNRLKNSIK